MKKYTLIVVFIIFIISEFNSVYAQFDIADITKIKYSEACGKAILSPDAKKILVSDVNQKGLTLIDLSSLKSEKMNDDTGAGNEVFFASDGESIVYKSWFLNEKGRRFSNVICQSVITGNKEYLAESRRGISGLTVNNEVVIFRQKSKLKVVNLNPEKSESISAVEIAAFTDNRLNLVLVNNGVSTILNPGDETRYLWVSLAPDKSKILYRVPGKGTLISDLNGNILAELGAIRAAKWSADGDWVIGMKDVDDGYSYIKSDIYVIAADGSRTYNVTEKSNLIALYPDLSEDNSKAVFTTNDGEVYIISFQ